MADIDALLTSLAEGLRARHQTLAVAESCTGGLLAAACTRHPGSSAWFERGFVTYSNQAKSDLLGVSAAMIESCGAVSEPVVAAMLTGVLAHSPADWGMAVSGVAGPGGGSAEKPVGTVCIGWMQRGQPADVRRHLFSGDRDEIRRASVVEALRVMVAELG